MTMSQNSVDQRRLALAQHPRSNRHKRMSILCSNSRTSRQKKLMVMDTWVYLLFVFLNNFIIFKSSYQTLLKIATKKLNAQRLEDYTFEGELNKAKDECSYMTFVNDSATRNKTIQIIKEKVSNKRLKEFYEEKEVEKQMAKKYYENVDKQSRKKVLDSENPQWPPPPPFMPPRVLPPMPPMPPRPPPYSFPQRALFKRSVGSGGRRRKTSTSFHEVSFTDHNNCSSRCIFARMEMVNPWGFPDESLITKLIDDKIVNKKTRLLKTKKVASCFRRMEEVVFEDSCIFSARLFDCLELGEPYLWAKK